MFVRLHASMNVKYHSNYPFPFITLLIFTEIINDDIKAPSLALDSFDA
jgi:hypothetical protein